MSLSPRRPDPSFWRGRRVLLTGHTGFKGAWLMLLLSRLGARVTGLSLPPEDGPALFPLLAGSANLEHHIADLRDAEVVAAIVRASRASVVLHLAAQALVPRGYRDPAGTFATNVTGTINLLQAIRGQQAIEAAVLVTTDKVYRNRGDGRRFQEDDPLGGEDPYSASKAAAEIAIACWRASYRRELPSVVTARAGNVIGGGDFAADRLVPDIVRALGGGTALELRHPQATRPWQHVLDVAVGYLLQAEHAATHDAPPPALNFGPNEREEASVVEMIAAFEHAFATRLPWRHIAGAPPEAPRLALDPTLAETTLGWRTRHDRDAAVRATADWYAAWRRGDDMAARCLHDAAEALA